MDELNAICSSLDRGVIRIFSKRSKGLFKQCNQPVSKSQSCHAHREILLVLAGESEYSVDGMLFPLTPGTIVLLDKWTPHTEGYGALDNHLIHVWMRLVDKKLSIVFFRVGLRGSYHLIQKRLVMPQDIYSLLLRRWNALDADCEINEGKERYFLQTVLTVICEEIRSQLSQNISVSSHSADNVILAIQNYIEHTCGKNCTLEHLEKISGYNRFYLSHRFHKFTGISLRDFINDVRRRFVTLALEQGLKQKEIAHELGFASPATFWVWLRRNRVKVKTRESK